MAVQTRSQTKSNLEEANGRALSSTTGVEEAGDEASVIGLLGSTLFLITRFLRPRDLFNLIRSRKNFRQHLTYQMVAESALFNGNARHKMGVENLYEVTSCGSVYLPSPFRFLQLMNVIVCEVCCQKKVYWVRISSGLALCYNCLKTMSTARVTESPEHRHRRVDDIEIYLDGRVCAKFVSRVYDKWTKRKWLVYLFQEPIWGTVFDPWAGTRRERIGPIATDEAMVGLRNLPSPIRIRDYLKGKYNMLPLEDYEGLNDAIRRCRDEGYLIQKRINDEKLEKYTKGRHTHIRAVKMMLNKICLALLEDEDAPLTLMDRLVHYEVNPDFMIYRRPHRINRYMYPCIVYDEDPTVEMVLEPFIARPSLLRTKEEVAQVVSSLKRQVERERVEREENRQRAERLEQRRLARVQAGEFMNFD